MDLLLKSASLLNSFGFSRRIRNIRKDSNLSTYASISGLDPILFDVLSNVFRLLEKSILQPLVAKPDETLWLETEIELASSIVLIFFDEEGTKTIFVKAEISLVGCLSTRVLGTGEVEEGVLARTATIGLPSLGMIPEPVTEALLEVRTSYLRREKILTSFILVSTSFFSSATYPQVSVWPGNFLR